MSETTYTDFGIRTTRGVYWQTGILIAVMLAIVLVRGATRASSPIFVFGDVVWLVGLLVWDVRLLRKLDAMGASQSQPTEAMKLLFHCATMLPMFGSLPLLLRA